MDGLCESAALSWPDLLTGIRQAFSSDKVDIDAVTRLLSSYESKREDWEPYAKFDAHRLECVDVARFGRPSTHPPRYTRNLVDEGNGRYNLIIICWGEGHAS